jgi:type I restriction enzyme R subunit
MAIGCRENKMIDYTKPIAKSRNFIVLDRYTQESQRCEGCPTENDLEREFEGGPK